MEFKDKLSSAPQLLSFLKNRTTNPIVWYSMCVGISCFYKKKSLTLCERLFLFYLAKWPLIRPNH